MRNVKNTIFILLLLFSASLFAQAPQALNYQAVARDGSGNPIMNQSITAIMGIYSGAGGATLEFEETHSISTNDYGMFTLKIGTGTVNFGDFEDIEWGSDVFFLQVEIDAGSGFVNLGKTQLISVPYALHAETVEKTNWLENTPDIYYNDGYVGVGTSVPNWNLHVHSISGPGYLSVSDATSGQDFGVRLGMNGSGNAYLINDYMNGKLNIGANGTYDMTINPEGMVGIGVDSPQLRLHAREEQSDGVYGSDLGVLYSTSQYLAPAIFGYSEDNTSDISYGVFGHSYSNDASYNMGIFAEGGGGTSNNYGVYAADFGEAGSGYSIAIYGDQSGAGDAGNFAGYFSGDVSVTGTLSKGGGSFKIDHPQDPANKYLYHSFVESPDMMNVYNGNITTNADGVAEVELPDYFETLNMDYRYQLTVIGEFADAIIFKEIENNRFTIKTSKPNVKVSWQVTGIRNDPWAQENRIIPEVEKRGVEKGKYLHPELYSRSADEGLPTGVK